MVYLNLFIKSDLNYCCTLTLPGEGVFVEIEKDRVRLDNNVIISVIYRPPNSNIARRVHAIDGNENAHYMQRK